MPCDSSHCEPTSAEKESQRVCECIATLCVRLGLSVPEYASVGAKSIYGSLTRDLDAVTARLCKLCEKAGDEIIYSDPKDRDLRRVATWWEDHQEQDRLKADRERENERQRLVERVAHVAKSLSESQVKEVIAFAQGLRTNGKRGPRPNSNKAGG